MDALPTSINRDIIVYAMPLFLMSFDRPHNDNLKYCMAIPGCIVAHIPMASKTRLILSAALYLLQVLVPPIHFFCLGFILQQAYNSNILVSKRPVVCALIGKVEIMGMACSEILRLPVVVRVLVGVLVFCMSVLASAPSVETSDPFESMRAKIDSAKLLNIEYRCYMRQKTVKAAHHRELGLFFTDLLMMVSNRKLLMLFCSFFSLGRSETVILVMGILLIYGWVWEYLCFVLKADPTPNVAFRVVVTYGMYILVYVSTRMISGL